MPRFSVVVPTFNYGRTLPTALDSIIGQHRDDVEIIVVDDASTDDTLHIVSRYGNKIQYLRNSTNLGPASAWSIGMRAATGEFVSKLDADDWLLPRFFTRVEQAFESSQEIAVVIGSVFDYREQFGAAHLRSVTDMDQLLDARTFRSRLLDHFFFRMPGAVLRRRAAVSVSPPAAELWLPHDWEFFLRATRGGGALLIAEPIAVYRIHDSSLTGGSRINTTLRPDVERFLELVRNSDYEGLLEGSARSRFAKGLAQTYLRIVGDQLEPRQISASAGHLWYAAKLAGSERGRLAPMVFWFGIREALGKLFGAISPAKRSVTVPIEDLLPVPFDLPPDR